MQIGEVAKRSSLTVDAIRFYEKRKLLPKAVRSAGRFRLYGEDAIERLRFIQQMQGLGFSLREVGELIELLERRVDACESVRELLKAKLTDAHAKLRDLRYLESELARDGFAEVQSRIESSASARSLRLSRARRGGRREPMKIEILYVPGCPHHQPAFVRLQKVLASEALSAEIRQVAVNTEAEAKALLFPGSPTIRIEGEDVEPTQNAPDLACRLYSNLRGVPSEQMLRLAISAARKRGRHGGEEKI